MCFTPAVPKPQHACASVSPHAAPWRAVCFPPALPRPALAPPSTLSQDEDTHLSLREILGTARGRLTVACNILALVGMAPFVVIEVGVAVSKFFVFQAEKARGEPERATALRRLAC